MSTVLVTGGAGYIGSHACKALKQHGFCPVVFDNLQNGHRWAACFGPLIVADLLDTKALDLAFQTYQPKAVLHFASSIDVRASMQNPSLYYQNNVTTSLNLLQAMQRHQVPSIVFSSSAAVYGIPKETPISEKSTCAPVNVYGKTKWMVEEMIHDFETAHGFRSAILRYFNAAGADPEGKLGEAHQPETHLIPLALRAARHEQFPLQVFGTDHATPDGSAIRDYIHVTDLAEAHVKAVEWLLSGKSSLTLNLGKGHGHSLLEVLTMIEQVSNRPVGRQYLARNPSEPPILVAQVQNAYDLLQWTPSFSDLKTIVQTAHDWHFKEKP